ncbi:MAG: type II toxin-antitoxin system mRNA interferase toxin, RelE/StbE family [Candidatus Paceibacterota bacterium]
MSFHRHFDKDYKKCSLKVREQFKKKLSVFFENPFDPSLENHALHGEWLDFRSINITGDYRALYHHASDEVVEFFAIDTHNNLYE